jgi:hypothetical protein
MALKPCSCTRGQWHLPKSLRVHLAITAHDTFWIDVAIALIGQKENEAANIVIRTLGCHRSHRVTEQTIAVRRQQHDCAANVIWCTR